MSIEKIKVWFRNRRDQPNIWRNLHLAGSNKCPTAFMYYAGLGANGVVGQKKIARELYRRFDRQVDVWQRNLWGHTGRYGEFRQSRMWNWTNDAIVSLRKLINSYDNRCIFILGHSTGALVAVVVAWLFEQLPSFFGRKASSARIVGVVLTAPSFCLRKRKHAHLLLMVLLLYYVLSPAMFIALPFVFPRLWDLSLLTALAFFLLLPRVRVPNVSLHPECGERPTLSEQIRCKEHRYRALALVVHLGITPVLLLLLSFVFPISYVRAALWLFLASIIAAFFYLPKGEVLDAYSEEEAMKNDQYCWLPVVTAATLLPLQWVARYAIRRLRCSVLMILAEEDRVVDNEFTKELFQSLVSSDRELLLEKGGSHTIATEARQLQLVDLMERWLRHRIAQSDLQSEEAFEVPKAFANSMHKFG